MRSKRYTLKVYSCVKKMEGEDYEEYEHTLIINKRYRTKFFRWIGSLYWCSFTANFMFPYKFYYVEFEELIGGEFHER